jgi:DeoR family fructose operon transcriptional repressor
MSQRLIPAQRRVHIQDHLAANRIVSASELSESLGMSDATIRRDLEGMERAGILERTHGGAIPSQRMRGWMGERVQSWRRRMCECW